MSQFESLRSSFNEVAELYDQVRPGYDEIVIDTIVAFAVMEKASRILEIGCGTGQITLPLAARGYQILALEPGNSLAALARKKCALYSKVTISQIAFEEWTVSGQTFDLVLSAQAFHWIEPYAGCRKAATALRSGGAIVLVWNNDVSQETSFYKATRSLYDQYLPWEGSTDWSRAHIHDALRASGAFQEAHEIRHPWERTYSCSEYLKLLQTYSDHRRLSEAHKASFFQAMESIIVNSGGTVTRKYETQIVLARRI